MLAVQTKVN